MKDYLFRTFTLIYFINCCFINRIRVYLGFLKPVSDRDKCYEISIFNTIIKWTIFNQRFDRPCIPGFRG